MGVFAKGCRVGGSCRARVAPTQHLHRGGQGAWVPCGRVLRVKRGKTVQNVCWELSYGRVLSDEGSLIPTYYVELVNVSPEPRTGIGHRQDGEAMSG